MREFRHEYHDKKSFLPLHISVSEQRFSLANDGRDISKIANEVISMAKQLSFGRLPLATNSEPLRILLAEVTAHEGVYKFRDNGKTITFRDWLKENDTLRYSGVLIGSELPYTTPTDIRMANVPLLYFIYNPDRAMPSLIVNSSSVRTFNYQTL